ncbi:P-loop containing nucleoside triphosphate hydrolase protein [Whalleya microplaca]|nr:P-loop containing nucleoside triphosphate hydrolase protein [Whalleya microplaca]
MGLGKTLTMVALAASDLHSTTAYIDMEENALHQVATTLIIVPPPLLGTWEEQTLEHVVNGALEVRRHHGKTKLSSLEEVHGANVILTTYHTVATEWKSRKATGNSFLFSVCWRRIILYEESKSRWAVSGTSIQNRLGDLASLLKFIRVHPYTDAKRFDADISDFWKSGEDEQAVKRLQRLSACLILRRSKGTINIPVRRDMQCPVDFTTAERSLYKEIRQKTITKIDDILLQDSDVSRSGGFVNVLQQIESLRLVCNMGLHYHTRSLKDSKKQTLDAEEWATIAQETFNARREIGHSQFSRCMKFICSDCSLKVREAGRTVACGHRPTCPMAPVSFDPNALDNISDKVAPQTKVSLDRLPSKVEALLADIKLLLLDVKCIVFSTWRLTVDIVQAGLDRAGLQSIRFDGKGPQKERQTVVNKFKTDPTIRVMLLTLSCGAVGLTLTVATRAYLMEPHWNPTLEEQALARIHRIGQTKEVTTVRFYIRDSFEEQVMEVQKSKKQLAGVLLSAHDGGQADDSLGSLQKLRMLL